MNHPGRLPAEYAESLALAADRLGAWASTVAWYSEISSTNDVAIALAERGADEGVVVAAEMQRSGRGRRGRVWASPAGAGLYVSVVLRPHDPATPLLTLAAGVGLAEGIERATGLAPRLKWPNDLYVRERKLGGVLAEAGASTDGRPFVVLGFGVNVRPASYPPDVAGRATALESELGRPIDSGLLLTECLAGLARWYAGLHRDGRDGVLSAWRARAGSIAGRSVEWDAAGHTQRGVAEAIDEDGALQIRTDAGPVRVVSGEVRWLS